MRMRIGRIFSTAALVFVAVQSGKAGAQRREAPDQPRGRPDTPQSARAAVQAQYNRAIAAFGSKNLGAFAAICTPDCRFVDKKHPKGIPVKEFVAGAQQALPKMKSVKLDVHIDSFALKFS